VGLAGHDVVWEAQREHGGPEGGSIGDGDNAGGEEAVGDEARVAVGGQGHAKRTGKSSGQHARVAVLGEGEAEKARAREDRSGMAECGSVCTEASRA
jgi:hypothetical protein